MACKYTTPQPDRSALLTIDVQRDFVLPGAPAETPGAVGCLPAVARLVEAYRRYGLPIIHVVRLYLADGSNADACRREAIEEGRPIVNPGSPGAELMDVLKPDVETRLDAAALLGGGLQPLGAREWVMYKPRWDAFFATPLDSHLHKLDVTTVVVVGCNFPNCPRATIYGASMRDFRVVMPADAVSGVYAEGLRELNRIGVTTAGADEYLASLAQSGRARPREITASP